MGDTPHDRMMKKAKKDTRYRVLLQVFRDKHMDNLPLDKFDEYLLKLLCDLGEVYDENQDEIRNILRKNTGCKKRPAECAKFDHRERGLNSVSIHLRTLLGLNVPSNFGSDSKQKAGRKAEVDPLATMAGRKIRGGYGRRVL